MKYVILDYPDWIRLKKENKVHPALNGLACMRVLVTQPETKDWKWIAYIITNLVYVGVAIGVILCFTKLWLGILLILFVWFPLRQGVALSIKQEVLRAAEKHPRFFSMAIIYGALRFLVEESDLIDTEFMDGNTDLSYRINKYK